MQGKENLRRSNHEQDRITPACAGKRFYSRRTAQSVQDHPCVCREKIVGMIWDKRGTGSPLRVQGKAMYQILQIGGARITPACAGKSLSQHHHLSYK